MFRPCIDLHDGQVKQIVGGTLSDGGEDPTTNFVSNRPPAWYAKLYQKDGLRGGHVVQLGPGNETAAREALAAFPSELQLGGGVNLDNATDWLDAGASHVIVTSWVFREGHLDSERLDALVQSIGRKHLVLDLSCRQRDGEYWVVTDRWQNFTKLRVNEETLRTLSGSCAEFLVHAVDVEGRQTGVDLALVEKLTTSSPIPCTYAGGANSIADLEAVHTVSNGSVHLTIGSALDIFGGTVKYDDCIAFNLQHSR